ncbi:hypothetical protein [Streptomyces sp. SCL15-4]|uniref:hypothetical protein n=1 Tax=Streptomyces sp. SCL15-4 TaxID=2967221 RepID=UPI0029672537|nr:hypothetical protein [Streptomyces sp. SCL15-4]
MGHPLTGASYATLLFGPHSKTLATAGTDGAIRLLPLDADRAIRRICTTTGQSLTRNDWTRYVGSPPYRPPCP